MKKVYVGGALFSEGEIAQRLCEADSLRENENLSVFNPIEAPINNKADLPTALDIFWGDTTHILFSDYILAELNNKIDEGLVAELAIAWTMNWMRTNLESMLEQNSPEELQQAIKSFLEEYPHKEIVCHASDIRLTTASEYSGITIPIGFNQYVIGMLQASAAKIFNDSTSATEFIKGKENG